MPPSNINKLINYWGGGGLQFFHIPVFIFDDIYFTNVPDQKNQKYLYHTFYVK